MLSAIEAKDLIDEVFEEEVLALGGLVATRAVDDELVWGIVRSFDVIRARALRRVRETAPAGRETDVSEEGAVSEPHPAIEVFLNKLRSG